MEQTNQRKIGVVLSYISLIANAVIGFLYVPLLLHAMGQAEYGLYQLMGSFIAYFSVMDFGLSSTITRYFSKYKTLGDNRNMENVLALSSLIYLIITLLVLAAGAICYWNLEGIFHNSLTPGEIVSAKKIFIVLLINIVITIPSKIFDAVIISYERFVYLKLVTILQIVIQPFVVIAVMQEYPYALGVVIVQTLFNLLLVLAKAFYSLGKLKMKIKLHAFDRQLFKSMMGFSFFVFLGSIMDQLFWRTNPVILGIVSNTVVVAVYSTATTIFNAYMSLSTVITSVFLPKVTGMVAENAPRKELSDLFIRIGRLQFLLLSCVLSGFILFGQQFIDVWVGPGYEDAYWITLFLIVPFTVDLIQNIGITILQAENKLAFRSVVFLAASVINILVSIPTAKYFGGPGCAFTTGLTFFIADAIIMNVYYARKIGIEIKAFWLEIAKIGVFSILCTLIGTVFNWIPLASGYINLGIKIIAYLMLFVPVMYFFVMNSYEKRLLKNIVVKLIAPF